MLAKLQLQLEDHLPNIRSVLVVRHGYLVFEYYGRGLGRDDLHELQSVTKSVTSALVGIALDQHYFHDLDQKIVDFLPEARAPNVDPQVKDITLRHLLTMTSGFEWSEQAKDECLSLKLSSCSFSFFSLFDNDWIKAAIKRPVVHPPGQVFNYDSPAAHLLSVMLARATKMDTAKFAEQYLFVPLGISRYRWPTDDQGYNYGAFGLELTARDMAKFGQLYLNRGVWNGKQLIPSVFVEAATRKQTVAGWPATADYGYGYLWWVTPGTDNTAAYFANGRGGQLIVVAPHLDMVIVITANQEGSNAKAGIVREFIFPAVLK